MINRSFFHSYQDKSFNFFRIFILFQVFFLLSCGRSNSGDASSAKKIVLKGSDTGLPISQKMAEEYMYKFPEIAITVVGGGSGVGISALRSGTTDIAISSRSLKTGEKLRLQAAGIETKEVIIGYDALAVIVHPSNPITQLTRQQIEDIYTGKFTNWKDFGGKDAQIVVISRESSSGTFEFFKDHVLKKKNFTGQALLLSATGAITESVSQNPNAVAYVGIAYINKNVKALAVSFEKDNIQGSFVFPTIATAKDKSYPISRPLFFYYPSKLEKKLAPFIQYTTSAEGQKNVAAVGYVPL